MAESQDGGAPVLELQVSNDINMKLQGVDVRASDWHNRIRDVVLQFTKMAIPKVGALASFLLGSLWPEDKVDIFESLKADVLKLVRKEILDNELSLHEGEIAGLKQTIERYNAAMDNERAYFLNSWITGADNLRSIFEKSTNNIHLILPIITLSLLHLTALRERLDFGMDLYHEDNREQWREELEDTYKSYIVDILPDLFNKWKVWRAEQVQISAWVEVYPTVIPPFFQTMSHATVVETLTGEMKRFSANLVNSATIFAKICEDHKARMCNDATADMAGCVAATFVFYKLLPNNNASNLPKYDEGVFGRMFRGPYSQDLLLSEQDFGLGNPVKIFRSRPDHDDYSLNSGPITKVVVREWNTIDAMQLIYANYQGNLVGNSQGGARHDIDVSAGPPISGLRMGFSNGVLTYVQIMYYDGTSSSTYGNRSGWTCYEASVNGPATYIVSSWSYKADYGPSDTYGPSVIQLEYTPQIE